MATYIKFLAGNFEGQEYRLIGNKNRLACRSSFRGKALHLTDFASIEVASEESLKRFGGSFGGALVGGVLLGGAGALAGALSGGNSKESTVLAAFRDGSKSLAKANEPMLDAIRVHLFKLEQNPNYAPYPYPKSKMALWKKIVIVFFILILISAFGAKKDVDKTTDATTTHETSKK